MGEGGGQVLRSSLTLAMASGQAVGIAKICARRAKPGLLRQHLTCVQAAAEISDAEVEGAELGSQDLTFRPRSLRAGSYRFAVGTAGSCLLVLRTLLPVLVTGPGPVELRLEGGTHNPDAPPWEFIERAYLPALAEMGAQVEARLERRGFMPAGGGRTTVKIAPVARLQRFERLERGAILDSTAEAIFANLPVNIAKRELAALGDRLGLPEGARLIREVRSSGPGNALVLTLRSAHFAEVICSFGLRNRSSETVARLAAKDAEAYLASTAAVGRRLADQLLVPLALGGGGGFTTLSPSRHTVTNAEVIRRFLPVAIGFGRTEDGSGATLIEVDPADGASGGDGHGDLRCDT